VECRLAIAGPLTSLILGGAFWGLFYVLPSNLNVVLGVVNWLGWINLSLGVFNLIPAFPMDGGRVFRSIIWWRTHNLRRATQIAAGAGKVVAVIFILGGIYLFFFTIYGLNGLWLALIGWFLYSAASSSYRQLMLQQALQGHEAKEIMNRECTIVPPDTSVDKLVNEYVLPAGKRCFIVSDKSRPQGMVTLQEIKGVPKEDRDTKSVSQIMKSVSQLKTVGPDEDLSTVMRILTEQNVNQVPVVDKGELVGMISRENLLNFINLSEGAAS
jgi:CBS domain-containing protein